MQGLVVAPGGGHVYAATQSSDAVVALTRNATTGALTQTGCVSETGTGGACTDGIALDGTEAITISPDGAHVYLTAGVSDAVIHLTRNATTGALAQTACVSETGTGGACTDGTALDGPEAVTVSPGGAHVYAVTDVSDAVVRFTRNAVTGALAQTACVSETGTGGACTDGTALDGASAVEVSPDGQNVYAAARFSNAVAIFTRDATTGGLGQQPGTAGCISDTGTGGLCVDGTALVGVNGLAVTPDGADTYATASLGDAIVILTRTW